MVAHQAGMARTQGTGPADSKPARGVFKTLRAGEPEGHGPQQGNCIPDPFIIHGNGSGRPVWAKLRWMGREKPFDGLAPGSALPIPERRCLLGGPRGGRSTVPIRLSVLRSPPTRFPDPFSRPRRSPPTTPSSMGIRANTTLQRGAGIGCDLLRSDSRVPFATCPSFSCSAPREEPPC